MTGALRLLSLLNLSGLFRRANMNQLFDPGVTFDSAGGSFNFSQGDLRIPDFSIEGSGDTSASVAISILSPRRWTVNWW